MIFEQIDIEDDLNSKRCNKDSRRSDALLKQIILDDTTGIKFDFGIWICMLGLMMERKKNFAY